MSAQRGGRSAKAKDRDTSKECQEREQVRVTEQHRKAAVNPFGGVIQLEGISSWEVRDRWRRDSTVWSGSTGREEEKRGGWMLESTRRMTNCD